MGDVELSLGIAGFLYRFADADIVEGFFGDLHTNNAGLGRWDFGDLDPRNILGRFQGCQIKIIDSINLF